MKASKVEQDRERILDIVREGWAIYRKSGLKADADIAREYERLAREALADMPPSNRKAKKSRKAMKRHALKRSIRIDAEAPILQQIRK